MLMCRIRIIKGVEWNRVNKDATRTQDSVSAGKGSPYPSWTRFIAKVIWTHQHFSAFRIFERWINFNLELASYLNDTFDMMAQRSNYY